MDSVLPNPKNQQRCNKCNDGRLDNDIYFYHFNLISNAFCDCIKGKLAFNNWLKLPEVKRAYRNKQEGKIKKALELSEVPMRWQGQNINDVGNKTLHKKLGDYLQNFVEYGKKGTGVYLHNSSSDTERTRLLTILCMEIIGQYSQPCIFLSESQIFAKIQSSFGSPENGSSALIKELQEVGCLFIDNFGSKIKQWHCEQLQNILESRFHNSLPTFFSSFYSLHEYRQAIKKVLPREQQSLPSLVAEMCKNFDLHT